MKMMEQWRNEQTGLRGFWPRFYGYFLFGLTCIAFAPVVRAQTAPDTANAAVSALGVTVNFTACVTSEEGNCVLDFAIYRNPPGFTQNPVYVFNIGNANLASHFWIDQKVTIGQSYSYEVCSGDTANNDRSNCKTTNMVKVEPSPPPPAPQPTVKLFDDSTSVGPSGGAVLGWTSTNATSLDLEPGVGKVAVPAGSSSNLFPKQTTTYTITATGPGGTATANAVVCGPMFPTQNLSLYVTALKWTNPNQTCQSNPSDIPIYRWTPSSNWSQRADLPAENGVLPSRYVDQDDLLPHSLYVYEVCQGLPSDGTGINCASSNVMSAWGADPVLTAVPVSTTSVKLEIAVDDAADIQTISVTRGVIGEF